MIKSLTGKTNNINAALKSSDAEVRAKLNAIKEVESVLFDSVLSIAETLERLTPFIQNKAGELKTQNNDLRNGFHNKGITQYDNVMNDVDKLLEGLDDLTDIDIGAITGCLTQDNFKNDETGVICVESNMADTCYASDADMPSCSACVFGISEHEGQDTCTSGHSNCGGCYGGRNATMKDVCTFENTCESVSGVTNCSLVSGTELSCISGVSCTYDVTCVYGLDCGEVGGEYRCERNVICNSGDSCSLGDAGERCGKVSCSTGSVACSEVGASCTSSVSCTVKITGAGDCTVVGGVTQCETRNNGSTCSSEDSCGTVSPVCTGCNTCEGCNNCNEGCNSCETCDGCNQCNTYAGCRGVGCPSGNTCTSDSAQGPGGAICKTGKGCVGDFAGACGSFFK